ncbi:MAG: T9SS type A sorting domain-containing protein [Candidatus Neomarinimicrobiota bacterium]
MKRWQLFAVLFTFGLGGMCKVVGQTSVFTDDFSTNQDMTWTTSGQIGSSTWYVNRSGDDWGARRNTNGILELTNDADTSTNVNGWVFAYTITSDFSSPYNKVLSSNPDLITWYFNLRQPRTDPAGFGSKNYGVAFILSGSSVTANSLGNGYAIALGQSGDSDPLRLVKYTGGLSTLSTIITSNTEGLSDFGNEYISVRVTYDPATDRWELFLRNDGSSFTDPQSGSLVSQGMAIDDTYTNTPLEYMGGYWQGSTAADQTALFDNVNVTVVPAGEPTIVVSPITLSGFSYVKYSGPSADKSFTVSGSNLTANISVSPPTNYEISTETGYSFSAMNPVTLAQTGGIVSETPIYVRLKSGLEAGIYNEDVIVQSAGATSKMVSCSGIVLPNAWINEIHYDNDGGDLNEGFEVVIENAGINTLSDFTITLYNGSDSAEYGTHTLDGFITGSTIENFTIYYKLLPANGLQNGAPDGLALSYQGNIIQFLSYEGTFTATDGPASGIISTDIGVSQGGTDPVGETLQLIGNGTKYSDFTWSESTLPATWGAPNSNGADQSLPVELTDFAAVAQSGGVLLSWTTESETENLGFIVQRQLRVAPEGVPDGTSYELPARMTRSGGRVSEWEEIASYTTSDVLAGHGSTSEAYEYAYTDATVVPGATYLYRLGDVDYSGKVTWHKEVEVKVEVEDGKVPVVFGLKPAYPNPFNPSVTIPYGLSEDGNMTLKVYNLRGQLVEILMSTYTLKGTYSYNWQPVNLSAGIYFVRMQAGNRTSMQKVVFVK